MATFLAEEDQFDNIWVACTNGDIQKVTAFLASGIDVNSQDEVGFSPIHAAASYGHCSLLDYLIANGANVNLADADGDTPLLNCEDQASFELLERAGANINARNNEGEGLAEKAVALAEEENEAMVTFLFNRGFIPVDFRMSAQKAEEQEESAPQDDEVVDVDEEGEDMGEDEKDN